MIFRYSSSVKARIVSVLAPPDENPTTRTNPRVPRPEPLRRRLPARRSRALCGDVLGLWLGVCQSYTRCPPGFHIPLQALQVSANVSGVLVACLAVLLQRFADDPLQLLRQSRIQLPH